MSSLPPRIFFSLSWLQNDLNFFVKVLLTIFINWFPLKYLQAKILRFSNSRIYNVEAYQVLMPFPCNSLDKSYACFSNPSFKFSNLHKCFTIEKIMAKCIGKRPVSDRTAEFEEYLFTPKMYFKYLIWDLSATLLLHISSDENALSFLQATQLIFVLKTTHISAPYKTMG